MAKLVVDKNGKTLGELSSTTRGWVRYMTSDGRVKSARAGSVKVQDAVVKMTKHGHVAKGESVAPRTCGKSEFDLANYARVKTPGGNVSFDNADTVATRLRGKTLDEVYTIVAREAANTDEFGTIAVAEAAFRKRYAKLNVGMQRMNLGNRLRGYTQGE